MAASPGEWKGLHPVDCCLEYLDESPLFWQSSVSISPAAIKKEEEESIFTGNWRGKRNSVDRRKGGEGELHDQSENVSPSRCRVTPTPASPLEWERSPSPRELLHSDENYTPTPVALSVFYCGWASLNHGAAAKRSVIMSRQCAMVPCSFCTHG